MEERPEAQREGRGAGLQTGKPPPQGSGLSHAGVALKLCTRCAGGYALVGHKRRGAGGGGEKLL